MLTAFLLVHQHLSSLLFEAPRVSIVEDVNLGQTTQISGK